MDLYAIATALLRGLHVAGCLSMFGCLVFRCFVMPRGWRDSEPCAAATPPASTLDGLAVRMRRIALFSGVLALLAGAAWLADEAGSMAGAADLSAMLDAIPIVAGHTGFGNFLCARLVLLAGALLLVARRAGRRSGRRSGLRSGRRSGLRSGPRIAALFAAGAAIALQPMLGHIGASDVPVLIPIEAAHLLAAGAWLGGLTPLLLYVARAPAPAAAQMCERFTPVGLVAVGTIAVTALPQAGELIGGLAGLFGTSYGHLALLKLGLFGIALVLACLNRLMLTARLRIAAGRHALLGSIAVEVLAVFAVVLAASTMASSIPAEHAQPVWPFAWRPGLEAWYDPNARWQLERLMAAACVALAAVGASLVLRRFRLLMLGAAVLVVAPFTSALGLLLEQAWPTSYARSTTGFSVDAIVRGQVLFGTYCAECHAPREGSGGTADLAAPHIWGHLDGELFWWVTNGVQNAAGDALMPGFGSALSEDDRWSLIDFIRAHNAGRQAATTGHWSPPVPAPSTPLACADASLSALTDLAMHVVVVVAGTARGMDAGTARGTDAGTARGTDAGTARGTVAGTARGTDAGAARGTDAGTARGTDTGTARGADIGTARGTVAGTARWTDAGTVEEKQAGSARGARAGSAAEDVSPPVVVWLVRASGAQPEAADCLAASADAWEAWRVLAGVSTARFAGYRAVIDGQGWMRAWLPPDAGSDRLLAAVRDARDHPIAAGARPVAHHH